MGEPLQATLEEQIATLQLALAARDATIAAQHAIISEHEGRAAAERSRGGPSLDCSIVVECRKPFRVLQADDQWLEYFGFRRVEVEGRSIRVCFGPETDAEAIHRLLHEVAQGPTCKDAEGVWSKISLYDKSGDVHHMLLQARYEHAEKSPCSLDVADAPVPWARLSWRVSGCGPSPGVSQNEVPMLKLSCNETSPLLGHNQAFLDLYAIPSAHMLEARGVALIFGPTTDGRRWKSLIKQASNGAIKTCSLATYTTDGDEIVVDVTMRPDDSAGYSVADRARPLQLVASFELRTGDVTNALLAPGESSWPSSTTVSTASSSSNCSADSASSKGCAENSPTNSEFDDAALKVHLRAMRIHKMRSQKQNMENRGHDDLAVVDSREKDRRVALTCQGAHSHTFTFGQRLDTGT
eukprot:Tamp_16173.p1 GENE.Tamp_16173~~Tamp_16173.p1  ORF type:complete len:410 (-),score=78.87 Tamp_16173:185-1414(-)